MKLPATGGTMTNKKRERCRKPILTRYGCGVRNKQFFLNFFKAYTAIEKEPKTRVCDSNRRHKRAVFVTEIVLTHEVACLQCNNGQIPKYQY